MQCFCHLEQCIKPSKNIYNLAVCKLQSRAEEIVLIDENLDNVIEAKKCGMRGIWFSDVLQLERELRQLSVKTF
jgi:HAD superfamily hydrolase (TIGR01509 family)